MNIVLIIYISILSFFFLKWLFSRSSKTEPYHKYKDQFRLNKEEGKLIDKQFPLIKEHFSLDICIEETIRFYIRIYRKLPAYKRISPGLNKQLMQYCIYLIKEKYDFLPDSTNQVLDFQENFFADEITLIEKNIQYIPPLTDENEEKLFAYDNQRWKRKFDELTLNFDINQPDDFYGKVIRLASLNKRSRLMDLRNIYYKSYLFMVQNHKETSLKFYLHYLHVKSASETFKHKQISARNESRLFSSKEQKKKFDSICNRLQKDNKLEKALEETSILCLPVRKKISLNVGSIQEANEKQTKVAQLLSTYLDDESVPEISVANTIAEKQQEVVGDNQKELFGLFTASAFRLNQQEVHIFAQSRGLFKDQFIESINDQFYETLDDLLIEEDGEEYILNEEYYTRVVSK